MIEIGIGGWLAALAAEDLRKKQVKIWHMAAAFVPGILYVAFYCRGEMGNVMGGIGVGLFLCLLSGLTEKGIGMGDGLVTMIIGIYSGMRFTLLCLLMAFFLVSPVALILYLLKRMKKRETLPFIPFLFAGYVLAFFVKRGCV